MGYIFPWILLRFVWLVSGQDILYFFLLSPDRACKLKFSCRFLVVNSGLKIDLYKKKEKYKPDLFMLYLSTTYKIIVKQKEINRKSDTFTIGNNYAVYNRHVIGSFSRLTKKKKKKHPKILKSERICRYLRKHRFLFEGRI